MRKRRAKRVPEKKPPKKKSIKYRKGKPIKEVTKRHDEFMEGKEENPDAKEDFERLLEKAVKPQSDQDGED